MKKNIFSIISVLIIAIAAFGYNILNTTGFFRTVKNQMNGKIILKVPISGVEDLTIDENDDFGIFISYNRAAERDGKPQNNGIYFLDFRPDTFELKEITGSFKNKIQPHGISLIQLDSNHHKLFIVNHFEGESIEIFDLYNRDSLVHDKTLEHELIYSANDIVAISETQFYFTNDHYYQSKLGLLFENYSGISKCETIYFDGENYRIVNNNMAYANGINYDKNRNLMFIASPRGFLINVFERTENGDLNFVESIDCETGVDNIELDKDGNIWVGCHPNLLTFDSYNKGKRENSPSEIIKINYRKKGDYDIEKVYINDGEIIAASTVAGIYKDLIIIGSVLDDHFVVLRK
jgi:arylesterase/paraoxonase